MSLNSDEFYHRAPASVGPGTLGDIHAALADEGRSLAPTTVATLLQRLSTQGWVKHKKRGRHFVYRALIDEKEAADSVLKRMLSAFCATSASVRPGIARSPASTS